MPTDVATDADRLLDYLADRGGVAEVPPGQALLRDVAEDLGLTRAELTKALSELESESLVVREVKSRRVYRLSLTDSATALEPEGEHAPEPETTPAPAPPSAPPAAAPGSSWAPIEQPAPEPVAAKKGRFGRKGRSEKAPKAPPARSGVVYEVREMGTTTFEGLQGTVLSRHKGPGEAFAEVRRLHLKRSGGKFTPRVVVRVDPDGTEDVAIPFNERARPVHFDYNLPGGRV